MKSTCELTVRGYELDSFGHVNNAVYLNYAETAMWHCLNRYGLVQLLRQEGLFPVILETSVRYIHELHLLDQVRIETEMHCSAGLIQYTHTVIQVQTGLTACRIKGKLAYVNGERMICDIPQAARELMEQECNED